MKYRVEFEGYNDGRPYEVSSHDSISEAMDAKEKARKDNPRVRYRLIRIVEDFA